MLDPTFARGYGSVDDDTTFVTALTTTAFPQNRRGFFQAFV